MSGSVVKVGIIGGSGLNDPDILENRKEKDVDTPYGKPSDVLIEGTIKGVACVLLARHGRQHNVNPTNINYRANVFALKEAGCTHLLVSTACGSLQEAIKPGDLVILDQFIDRTHMRKQSFYDGTNPAFQGVCHVPMHTPFCPHTRKIVIDTAKEIGVEVHEKGTVLTIEGPRFSSRAESMLWHQWGAHVVNMTTIPEVVLAKELGLCYSAIAMATDYDCWREGYEDVSVEMVLKTFKENSEKTKKLMLAAIPKIAEQHWAKTIQENEDMVKGSILHV